MNSKINHPPKNFLLGHFPILRSGNNKCIYDAFKKAHEKYGDNYKLHIGRQRWIVMSDADLAKEVFVKNHQVFKKGRTLDEAKAINIGKEGLTLLENDKWKQTRTLYAKYFTNQAILATTEIANNLCKKIIAYLQKYPNQELTDLTNRIAFSFIVKVSCDYDPKLFDSRQINDPVFINQDIIAKEFLKRIQRTPAWKYVPTIGNFAARSAVKSQRDFFYKLIEEYKNKKEKSDFCILNNFLSHTTTDKEFLIDNVWTVLGAAYESTATALHWFFYEMTQNPKVYQKLMLEINSLFTSEDISHEQITKAEYLNNCILENLRLHTPFGFISREAKSDLSIGDAHFKKGEFAVANLGVIHQREKYWGKDPHLFDPTRFDSEEVKSVQDSIYAPFGYGPRKCIGQKMSLHEMAIIIASILKNFKVESLIPDKVQQYHRFTLTSLNGINVKFS